MKVKILCPSPLINDAAIKDLIGLYTGRLDYPVDIKTVKTRTGASDSPDIVMKRQGDALRMEIEKANGMKIIALDETGRQFSSRDFAAVINRLPMDGFSGICFVIGGAYGLSPEILKIAHQKLSLSAMTWPHRLVAVMLLEQLYRSRQISKGHPYHKD